MNRSITRLTLTLLLLVIAPTALGDLKSDVRKAMQAADLGEGIVAVTVRDVGSESQPLLSIRGREQMIPASNMKLLTTGTALQVLGGDFNFRTSMVLDGDRLIIIGDGDPGLGDPMLLQLITLGEEVGVEVDSFIDYWLRPIIESGVTHLSEVVVDDRIFDREFVHPTWPEDQLDRRYCAEVAGLTFHLNLLNFHAEPIPNHRPHVRVQPQAPWLSIVNRATSRTGPKEQNSLSVARPLLSNKLTLYGNVKSSARVSQITVHDPPEFFARLVADRLIEAGVEVDRYRAATEDDPASAGTPIGPVVRTPIGTAITRCNRDSYNLYAEALLKRAGHAITNGQPGTWANGSAAVRLVTSERLGDVSLSSTIIAVDGSGMSRENRVSTDAMAKWLSSFARDPELGEIFINSLAVGGSTGTLDKRFKNRNLYGTIVQAKSGFINGVSCLSGYVTAPDGRRRSFSILCNELTKGGSVGQAKIMQEAIVEAVAKDLIHQPAELGG